MFGLVTAPQGSTPQYTADQIKPIEQFYAQMPEAAAWTAISGFPTVVDGNAVLRLKPWEERTQEAAADRRRAAAEVRGDSRRDRVPDQSAVARPVVPLDADRVRDHVAGAVCRAAAARRPLRRRGAQVSRACRTCRPTCASTRRKCACASTATSCPTSASPVDTVGRTLETMLGGRQVTRFKREGEQYDVIVQVAPVDRTTPADISDSYVRARDGSMVQLVEPGRRQGRRRAAVAQPLQPAARGQGHRARWRPATRSTKR